VNEKRIKVTDKRLFTADGELREEFRDLEAAMPKQESRESERASTEPSPTEPYAAEPAAPDPSTAQDAQPAPPPEAASFYDLVAAVAQPIALYLGDVKMPDGESMENLPLARLHIDLLEILQARSAGNLTDQEGRFLEDLLYQLRLRYVEKSGQG
jgi:hypothetical protein